MYNLSVLTSVVIINIFLFIVELYVVFFVTIVITYNYLDSFHDIMHEIVGVGLSPSENLVCVVAEVYLDSASVILCATVSES